MKHITQDALVPVRFRLRNSRLCQVYLSRCQFSSYFASERLSFHEVLPQKCLLPVRFTSETLSFHKVLPQEILLPVRFYLRKTVFLSNFTSGDPSSCQILPPNPLVSLRFFSSESPGFSHILPQNPRVLPRFCLRNLHFLSDFTF